MHVESRSLDIVLNLSAKITSSRSQEYKHTQTPCIHLHTKVTSKNLYQHRKWLNDLWTSNTSSRALQIPQHPSVRCPVALKNLPHDLQKKRQVEPVWGNVFSVGANRNKSLCLETYMIHDIFKRYRYINIKSINYINYKIWYENRGNIWRDRYKACKWSIAAFLPEAWATYSNVRQKTSTNMEQYTFCFYFESRLSSKPNPPPTVTGWPNYLPRSASKSLLA